ncbi:MAG: hypothetical protein ACO395_07560 [Pontimonas sp.]
MFHIVLDNGGRYDHIATESARATGPGSFIRNPDFKCRKCRERIAAFVEELNEWYESR